MGQNIIMCCNGILNISEAGPLFFAKFVHLTRMPEITKVTFNRMLYLKAQDGFVYEIFLYLKVTSPMQKNGVSSDDTVGIYILCSTQI